MKHPIAEAARIAYEQLLRDELNKTIADNIVRKRVAELEFELAAARKALQEITEKDGVALIDSTGAKRYDEGAHDAFSHCAAIAYAALAAKGKEE